MTEKTLFTGFPRECLEYYSSLRKNNNKTWFDTHRDNFEEFVMEPARQFVTAMGERLHSFAPNIHADPRTNRSIFRIYRDTRFSKDKTPYKTHMAIFFWEGSGPKMECPGFYFHFDNESLLLGEGIYQFPRHILQEYRLSVVHPEYGGELADALGGIGKKGTYSIGGKNYRRVPKGFDQSHPRAELLLYNGMHVGRTEPIPSTLLTEGLIDHCMEVFKDLLPLHAWLVELIKRAA